MRALVFIALLVAACGGTASPSDQCPAGEDLQPWVWPVDSAQLSQCGRVADLSSTSSSEQPSIGRSYWTDAKMVKLSAQFEILSGAGQFRIFAGKESGPIVHREDTGPLSVSGEVVGGFARLTLQAIPTETTSMRWRVSGVRIE